MIELFNILVLPFIFLTTFSKNIIYQNIEKNFQTKLSNIEYFSLNFFIFLNILLILSILDLSIQWVSFIVISYLIINTLAFFVDLKNLINLKKYSFFLLLFYVLGIFIIANPDLGWDGKFHWYKKALNFFQDMGIQNLSVLPKYEYPHFGTYIWGLIWKISPLKYEYFGRLFYLLIFIFSVFSITDLIKNTKIKSLIFLSVTIICFNVNHFLGNQDILVFSFILLIAKSLFNIFESNEKNFFNFLMIFLISNILIWIKYEAIVFILSIYFVIIFSKLFNKNLNNLKFTILSLLFVLILKFSISYIYNINLNASFQFSGDYNLSQLISVDMMFYKIIFIFKYYVISLFKNPIMIVNLIILMFFFLKGHKTSKENLFIFITFNLSAFLIFYIIQVDFRWHIINGFDRYMLQYSGFSIIYLIIFINKFIKN